MWLFIYIISTGNCRFLPASKPTKPTMRFTFHIISHVEFEILSTQSAAGCNLGRATAPRNVLLMQGREASPVPGIHLGPCRQQYPADLRAAAVRRPVQRGDAEAVLRGHSAGHGPQQVADRAEAAVEGCREDVVVASGGHGPPREATGGRAAEATRETQNSLQDLS